MYYLQSRYYDPEVGRFINCDDTDILKLTQGTLNGANLFAYCNNDPVLNSDPSGELSIKQMLSFFGFVLEVLSFVKEFLKKYSRDKIGYISGSYLNIYRGFISTVIDGIILVGNAAKAAFKSATLKILFSHLRQYAKRNPQKFGYFLKNKILIFISKKIAPVFNYTFGLIAKCFRSSIIIKLGVANAKYALFRKYKLYEWISQLTSIGNIVSYILDIVADGQPDRWIRIKVRR